MIEDVAELFVPGQYNIRGEYTREAGYALARDAENFILGHRASVNNNAANVIWNTSTGAAGGTFQALNEASILAAVQVLDERNVPQEGRFLAVSPGQYTDLLTITRFSSEDFINGSPVSSGRLGTIYGIPVYKSNMLKVNSLTGYTNGRNGIPQPTPGVAGSPYLPTQDSFTGLPYSGDGTNTSASGIVTAMLGHKDWLYMARVLEPKVETSREVLFQADAVVTTSLYGAKSFRTESMILIHSAG